MARREERTSASVASIAARVLKRGWAMPGEARTLAASCLTQATDKDGVVRPQSPL